MTKGEVTISKLNKRDRTLLVFTREQKKKREREREK